MGGGAWWAVVHGVAKSRTQLSDFTFIFHFYALEINNLRYADDTTLMAEREELLLLLLLSRFSCV